MSNDLEQLNEQQFESRAILVGLNQGTLKMIDFDDSMTELAELAKAAGATVLGCVTQKRNSVDVKTYIGKGKVAEVEAMIERLAANTIIFNHELSGSQLRNIEEVLSCRIIDRTALILDIFALRAKSGIAKLQVELAQLKYRLPRLVGMGETMSRTGGGIGTRGPGEQKLELDRRRINKRLADLSSRLNDAQDAALVTKSRRQKSDIPIVALVGYTNAGKSSLMNYFIEHYSDSELDKQVYTENMLFATLDTFHRKVYLDEHKPLILIDTVGFVSRLPHGLVAAFKATLSEVVEADLLIHVVDAANEHCDMQLGVTEQTLQQIGADGIPIIVAHNKVDLLTDAVSYQRGDVQMSVKTGEGIASLIDQLDRVLYKSIQTVTMFVPYQNGSDLNQLMNLGKLVSTEHLAEGSKVVLQLDQIYVDKYCQYVVRS